MVNAFLKVLFSIFVGRLNPSFSNNTGRRKRIGMDGKTNGTLHKALQFSYALVFIEAVKAVFFSGEIRLKTSFVFLVDTLPSKLRFQNSKLYKLQSIFY